MFIHDATTCNPGISFGFFDDHAMVLNFAGLLFLSGALWIVQKNMSRLSFWISASLLLGGALENIAERVLFGCIHDNWSFFGLFFFNAADTSIAVGSFFLAVTLFLNKR